MGKLQRLYSPPLFQGWGKTRNYFEGWYFKLVDAGGANKLAFIPGIAYDKSGKGEAFVQVLDSTRGAADFHAYKIERFKAAKDRFYVEVGGNSFSQRHLKVDLPGYSGELALSGNVPWPVRWNAPGIMGWYAFAPFMECYHGMVSMDHRLEGSLQVDGVGEVDFSGGRGYIEKDWGRSFPKAWIWCQTNHFEGSEGTSLMFSVAHIPWLGRYFIGFLCAFYHAGKIHLMATYTGAKNEYEILEDGLTARFYDKRRSLEVRVHKAAGAELFAPVSGSMTGKVNESLDARVDLLFRENQQLVFEGTGYHAGFEIGGDPEALKP